MGSLGFPSPFQFTYLSWNCHDAWDHFFLHWQSPLYIFLQLMLFSPPVNWANPRQMKIYTNTGLLGKFTGPKKRGQGSLYGGRQRVNWEKVQVQREGKSGERDQNVWIISRRALGGRAVQSRVEGGVCQLGTEGCWENMVARSALVCKNMHLSCLFWGSETQQLLWFQCL